MKRISEIPPELLAEMTPAVRVFVESLLLQMAQMRAEIEELKSQVKRLTPQNSSVPPST
jgi:transposase